MINQVLQWMALPSLRWHKGCRFAGALRLQKKLRAQGHCQENARQLIRKIYKFRPEYSYFGTVELIDEREIDNVQSRIEWLYGKANKAS